MHDMIHAKSSKQYLTSLRMKKKTLYELRHVSKIWFKAKNNNISY